MTRGVDWKEAGNGKREDRKIDMKNRDKQEGVKRKKSGELPQVAEGPRQREIQQFLHESTPIQEFSSPHALPSLFCL